MYTLVIVARKVSAQKVSRASSRIGGYDRSTTLGLHPIAPNNSMTLFRFFFISDKLAPSIADRY